MDIDVMQMQIAQLIAFKNRFEPHLVEAYPDAPETPMVSQGGEGADSGPGVLGRYAAMAAADPDLQDQQAPQAELDQPSDESSASSDVGDELEEPKMTMHRDDLEQMAMDEGMSEDEATGFANKEELIDAILKNRK